MNESMMDLQKHMIEELLEDKRRELVIIRAFVERVEKRLPDYDTGRGADSMLKAYRAAVYDELATLEEALT